MKLICQVTAGKAVIDAKKIVNTGFWAVLGGAQGFETTSDARIALGAVAATPVRAPGAEEALIGKELTDEVIVKASPLKQGIGMFE